MQWWRKFLSQGEGGAEWEYRISGGRGSGGCTVAISAFMWIKVYI